MSSDTGDMIDLLWNGELALSIVVSTSNDDETFATIIVTHDNIVIIKETVLRMKDEMLQRIA